MFELNKKYKAVEIRTGIEYRITPWFDAYEEYEPCFVVTLVKNGVPTWNRTFIDKGDMDEEFPSSDFDISVISEVLTLV